MLQRLNYSHPRYMNTFCKIFVVDPCDLEFFSYECDIDIMPRVIVSKKPEVKEQNFGDHINIVPFEWESEEQFNKLALETIIKAAEINNQTVSSFKAAKELLHKQDLYTSKVLVSKAGYTKYGPIIATDIETIGPVNYSDYVYSFDDIADNEAYVITEPEYFGLISCRPVGDKELYGISICNIKGVVKVVIQDDQN